MSDWVSLHLDANGFPVLIDEDERINFANAKYNKSTSAVAGGTRQTRSGNPWFDRSTGRFANGPAGVTVRGGGELLKTLLNSSKAYISAQANTVGADSMIAVPAGNGKVKITLYKGGKEMLVFSVATENANPAEMDKPQGRTETLTKPGGTPGLPSSIPPNVDPEEWMRRMDMVRSAAREFDISELQDVKDWLAGRTTRDLSEEEFHSFLDEVNRHRISDLVDVLDQSLKRKIALRSSGKRRVRVVPPRGWVRRTLQNISDDNIIEIYRRLGTRGFSEDELKQHLLGRYDDDRRAKLEARV